MAHNKLLEMCKNAICVTNACGCFKLFVKSTLYSIALLFCAEEVMKKALSLMARLFFSGGAETPSSAWPNFFRLIFGQRTKFGGGGQIRQLSGLVLSHYWVEVHHIMRACGGGGIDV